MKSKPKFLFLLVFLCVHRTSHTVSYIAWSEVESLVVDRSGPADVFTVNMKPHHSCTNGTVSPWCEKLSATLLSSDHDPTSCKCICRGSFYSFIPPRQRCIDATMAKNLIGGCQRYFDEQSLLAYPGYPVLLTQSSTKTFPVSNAKSCTISQDYFTHDYNGFESNWKTINNNGFFGLSMTNNARSFTITWKADTAGTLSGRIIHLDVTCSKPAGIVFSGCILLKAKGTVTYTAPVHTTTTSNYLPVTSFGTSASPELTSSFTPPAQTTGLPAVTTGQVLHPSTSVVVNPIEPAKTTSTTRVSSSSAGGDGGNPGGRGTRSSGNNNGVVIGAVVGGALVLGIIVIIIVFWKWRKAGKTTEKQTKQGKNPVYGTSKNDIQLESPNNSESQTMLSSGQGNQPTYQGLIIANGRSNGTAVYSSPEDEYDNCTVYQSLEKPRPGTPVYQSLKAGQAEPAHTTGMPNLKPKPRYTTLPNATGTPIAKGNGATAIPNLKGKSASGIPKSKPGTKGQPSQRSSVTPEPVYNVLDGPGSEQGTTPEPLYNVLEGPDRGQDYEATNVDPLYNVLEGPNTTYDSAEIVLESNGAQNGPISGQSPDNDPLYNVLEGPESDQKSPEHGPSTGQEPLYNVLEGPGAKKIPLVEQGGPINEPLYNVLEGPDSGGSNQHAPNKPRPLSGHDNLAYEQTLEMDVPNAAVHRPGTQRESVYEALRGPTQDVYEALGQSGDPHSTC